MPQMHGRIANFVLIDESPGFPAVYINGNGPERDVYSGYGIEEQDGGGYYVVKLDVSFVSLNGTLTTFDRYYDHLDIFNTRRTSEVRHADIWYALDVLYDVIDDKIESR